MGQVISDDSAATNCIKNRHRFPWDDISSLNDDWFPQITTVYEHPESDVPRICVVPSSLHVSTPVPFAPDPDMRIFILYLPVPPIEVHGILDKQSVSNA